MSALTTEWGRLKRATPGRRFVAFHDRRRPHGVAKWLYAGGAVLAFAIGVVLIFIPGPAFVFFILAAALVAAQSRPVALGLDRGEVWLRRKRSLLRGRWRRWRKRQRARGHPG